KKYGAQAELFADQVGQSFARDRTHAGRHFLDDDQGDGGGNQRPEQRVAELCASVRIGENAARIVVNIRGNEAGTKYGKKSQQPVFQDAETGDPPRQTEVSFE